VPQAELYPGSGYLGRTRDGYVFPFFGFELLV
jgi:hypothetical protein